MRANPNFVNKIKFNSNLYPNQIKKQIYNLKPVEKDEGGPLCLRMILSLPNRKKKESYIGSMYPSLISPEKNNPIV